MLRLEDEDEGHFIAGLFLEQFRVPLSNHCFGILDSNLLHSMLNEPDRDLLDVEDIVSIKHGFKV